MELSPNAIPFFSCMDNKTLNEHDTFLCKAHSNLSHFDSPCQTAYVVKFSEVYHLPMTRY